MTRRPDLVLEIDAPVGWSPDGSAIDYVVADGGVENIWSSPLDGGPPRRLTDFDAGSIGAFAWSPDGTRIALSHGTLSSDIVLLEHFR